MSLQTVLKRRVRALESHLPAALDGDPRALHRARVASRRIREVLPLVSSAHPKARKRVRRLTGWLGRVRELDVSLGLLESGDLAEAPRAALSEARQQLQLVREKRRLKLTREMAKLDREKLGRRLRKLIDRAGADEDGAHWHRVLAARLARRGNELRRALEQAGAIYVPERLHAVRIAAKKLRYALEIAAELGLAGAAKQAATVRRTQVTLGELQDRHVLLRHLREASEGLEPSARQQLGALESRLEASGRELHARFLGGRESLNDALATIRREIVPALAHVVRGHKSLKATTATVMNGRSDRAVSHSARAGRGPRRGLA